jgi:hypothetical protein
MLKTVIKRICPSNNAATRSWLHFFIDRGYLQLAKQQPEATRTNLIQIMQEMNVHFLGTIKNTSEFPIDIQVGETTELDRTSKGRVIVQTTGQRTSFIACNRAQRMKIVVFRHGIGKSRAARVITNSPFFQGNNWVAEVKNGLTADGEVKRLHHATPPSPLPAGGLDNI